MARAPVGGDGPVWAGRGHVGLTVQKWEGPGRGRAGPGEWAGPGLDVKGTRAGSVGGAGRTCDCAAVAPAPWR